MDEQIIGSATPRILTRSQGTALQRKLRVAGGPDASLNGLRVGEFRSLSQRTTRRMASGPRSPGRWHGAVPKLGSGLLLDFQVGDFPVRTLVGQADFSEFATRPTLTGLRDALDLDVAAFNGRCLSVDYDA